MVAILRAVRISCALVVVMMAICSATTVATSKSTSAGVSLSTLHSPHASATIKRHLKRITDMKATETSEERALTFPIPGIDSFFSRMKSISETIFQKIQRWKWLVTRRSSDEVFQLLKLNKLGANLFEEPSFIKWATFVKKKYSNPEVATEKMLATLVEHYGEGVALTDVLVAGTKTAAGLTVGSSLEKVEDIAHKLLSLQFLNWKASEKTADDVFTFLRLKNEENELFKSPLFLQWVSFVKHRHPNNSKAANEDILSTLRKNYREEAKLADVLVAGKENTDTAWLAEKLLYIQFGKWLDTGKTVKDVYAYLRLKELGEKLFESPRFLLWLYFFGAHSLPNEYKAYRSAKETFERLIDEENKAAEMTQTADELNKPALQDVEKLAIKRADEAHAAVKSALVARNEAYTKLDELLFFNLRDLFDNDVAFRKSLEHGLTVDDDVAKEHAKELLEILNGPSPKTS